MPCSFSRLGYVRELALPMCAVSLKVLTMDTLYFMKSVSGMGLWKIILLTFQPLSLEPVSLFFPFHYCPCFCVYSWEQLVTGLWVPVTAHVSRTLPRPPFDGQMPGEPGVGVEMVCGTGIEDIEPHNWIYSQSTIGLCQKGKRCHVH